jgi:hypothetical protein
MENPRFSPVTELNNVLQFEIFQDYVFATKVTVTGLVSTQNTKKANNEVFYLRKISKPFGFQRAAYDSEWPRSQ